MVQNLLYVLILLAGFPVGHFFSRLCKDEIKSWKRMLIVISVVSLVLAVVISFTGFAFKFPVILTLFFVIIMNLVIVWKAS
jgi:membrane protein YdbS with pleckstrin-like domain